MRINRQIDNNLPTPQSIAISPPETKKDYILQTDKSFDNNNPDEKYKDQVKPSIKPSIRYTRAQSQQKGLQVQSLTQQSIAPMLSSGFQTLNTNQLSRPTHTNGSSGNILLSRSSLQSPPRSNPKQSLNQQSAPGLIKNYLRCCPSHSDEGLKRICSIPFCSKDILLCGDCMYEDPDHTKMHQQDIMLVNEFLDVVENEGNKHNWKTLLEKQKEVFSQNTYNLVKFPEKHATQYGEYIEVQKKLIQNDINIILGKFQAHLQSIENELIQLLNQQLQSVCQQLEELKSEIFNVQELDSKMYINPRGYLENQLQMNQNMKEVSQQFRWIRDILFGNKITIESQRARVQNIEQVGIQLSEQLKSPPQYTPLSKESLKVIDKRINQLATNATSEIRSSLKNNQFYQINTSAAKTDSFKKKLNPNMQIQDSIQVYDLNNHQGVNGERQIQNTLQSMNPIHLASIDSQQSQQYTKEYLINKVLESTIKDFNQENLPNGFQYLGSSKQSEYDYGKQQQKMMTFAGDGSVVDYTTLKENQDEKIKHTSIKNISNIPQTLSKDNEIIQNSEPFSRGNNFMTKQLQSYYNNNNDGQQTLQKNQSSYKSLNSNFQQNLDELEAVTPFQNVTPQKSQSSNWKDYSNSNQSSNQQVQQLQNQAIQNFNNKTPSSQPSPPTQQINLNLPLYQQYQSVQNNLETIPELNQSNSVNSLFSQQLSNTTHPLQDIEIMEGNKSVRVKTKNNNFMNLTQIPKEISLQQEKVNCLCVVGGALIACGDNKGFIKLYNISNQTCIGELQPHKTSISCISSFQSEQPYILSGSASDSLIHLWNIINEKGNISLRESQELVQGQQQTSKQNLNTNFISSLFDERNIIAVVNNFSSICVWDTKVQKKVQNIKPIIQQGDLSTSQVTSIHSMGKVMQSILIGYKCSKVGIYKVEYDSAKARVEENKIKQIVLLKQVDLGKGNVPSNISSLFNSKVFITIKKMVLVWDTKTFELCQKIDSYQNDSSVSDICDILVAQYSDNNQKYSVIQICKNDNRIIIQNPNSQPSTKHHIKDFKIIDSVFKEKLQFCKSHLNELFVVSLNQNKNTLIYWKMFESQ
ncbi:WD domain, G-beta repeat protein (macronuclear) [Tetrahymena thermophila SB210]|uniref:WD domain, G-beta repeat protein n=1 Tax=Tetrahymena thermophila (strain SB210) TaxID=312017 RepID=I7ML68_TETTS|nr:WD domain, G-beta repeat protein [Tetrahymena thermophila SB210]EAS01276.1 WD domain, G-beta repeat protein [Tetrahymena thermophila SB210]|eukprot:XP_001021521.1 WD domain, G-beta repeat protein [Tetrahymena thermophila SB210]